MGINAFAQRPDGSWIIGSFAGLFEVHPEQPEEPLRDYFSHEPVEEVSAGRPIGAYTVSGLLAGPRGSETYRGGHCPAGILHPSAEGTE